MIRMFVSVWFLSACATVNASPHPPPNFHQVRTGLYRGGHPDSGALDYLRAHGVRTIVDLEIADLIEATPAQIATELSDARARGFTIVHLPISAFSPALSGHFDAMVFDALGVMSRSIELPVYVHCAHGQDRTGLVIGLERVLQEHWAPARAYQEMLVLGFHPMFIGLDEYFERKTGWEP
jgi:tyrosine-protein phosphatase SIW14